MDERDFRRFTSRLMIVGDHLLWTGGFGPGGYGQINLRRKLQRVHRAAYEHFVGPIPDGYQIDHLCFIRCCCAPGHLEAVTQEENLRRVRRHEADRKIEIKPRSRAPRTHCKQGHELSGDNVVDYGRGRVCRQCRRDNSREYMRRVHGYKPALVALPTDGTSHCPRGHEYTLETVFLVRGDVRCRVCMSDFGKRSGSRRPAG